MKASKVLLYCCLVNASIFCMRTPNRYDEALRQVHERRLQKQRRIHESKNLPQRNKRYEIGNDKDNELMYMDLLQQWKDNRLKQERRTQTK